MRMLVDNTSSRDDRLAGEGAAGMRGGRKEGALGAAGEEKQTSVGQLSPLVHVREGKE
jgi:hypothetical protein